MHTTDPSHRPQALIVDDDLAPSQRRALEDVAKVKVVELYNAVVNPPDLVAKMGPTLERVAGPGNFGVQPKSSASEDFSFYQQQAPGMFFYLGVTPKDKDPNTAPNNHSPLFYADESALIYGVRALSNMAVDYMLASGS